MIRLSAQVTESQSTAGAGAGAAPSVPAAARHWPCPGMRRLLVRDLCLDAQVGVYADEHGRTQQIRITLDMAVTEPQPGRDEPLPDRLDAVVCYASIIDRVRDLVAGQHVKLVETLAEKIAAICLADSRVRAVRVLVEKLEILDRGGRVGVEIERHSTIDPSAIRD